MFVSDYLAKKGKEATDDMLLISYANLGQWYLAADSVEKAKYWLDRSVRLMEVMPQNLENVYYRTAVSRVYNSLGIYSVNIDMDYHKGISYFLKGFEIAEEYGDRSRYTTGMQPGRHLFPEERPFGPSVRTANLRLRQKGPG